MTIWKGYLVVTSSESSRSPSRLEIALSAYALAVFALLWVGLLMSALLDLGWPDQLWSDVAQLPIWAAILVWVLLLPIMAALYMLQSSWPIGWQLLGFAVIAGWTLVAIVSVIRLRRRSAAVAG